MKQGAAAARVLVATDNVEDAQQILRTLKGDFENVFSSTKADRAMEDFEEYKPDVLVLAFDSLDKAQRYYLGLYRMGQTLQQHFHRTVILCSKDEVKVVFDLCKKQYFDDYVLYWPQTFDAPRLAMSIWVACREKMKAARSDAPLAGELRAHARHLGDLETTLGQGFADADEQVANARTGQLQVERDIAGSIDAFSARLASNSSPDVVKDANMLAREIDQLKNQQIARVRLANASSIDPVEAWAHKLKDQIEPALTGTRTLVEKVRKIRRIVLVVEDNELPRQLVRGILEAKAYEILFATDARSALNQLRSTRPDVILMDINLPGLDGISLTKRLKASPDFADIPVIMMSGDSRRETVASSLEAGAAGFVVKPITPQTLMTNLEKILPP